VKRIIVFGTGGHARVVGSIIQALGIYRLQGFLDQKQAGRDERILGKPILGTWKEAGQWKKRGIRYAAFAVGDNRLRQQLHEKISAAGFQCPSLIHPEAWCDASSQIGEASVVCAKAFVGVEAKISTGCIINSQALIDHESTLGAFSHISPGCAVAGRVHIGEGAWLGINATVIDQVRIGSWSTVGAGAVVTKSVRSGQTVKGIPAR